MSNLRKYLTLLNKMFITRTTKDEKTDDNVMSELDHNWHKQMDQADREKSRDLVIFESKEKWLAFQKAWKQFMHDGKHKKYKVEYTSCENGRNAAGYAIVDGKYSCIRPIKSYYWKSDLSAEHHLLYAILRNKSLKKIFKPSKLAEGHSKRYYRALKDAADFIHYAITHNKHNGIEYVLKPFAGTLELDDLKKVSDKLKKIAERTSNFEKLELE